MNRNTEDFFELIAESPTSFHLVSNMAAKLLEKGFARLEEKDRMENFDGKYFVCRDGALIAFQLSPKSLESGGFKIFGAHSDSPLLKVKPSPKRNEAGFLSLAVEIYGSPLNETWFDRPLSLAGKVVWQDRQGKIHSGLVDLKREIAVIPSLAIHLKRKNGKDSAAVNTQNEMNPILALEDGNRDFSFDEWILSNLPGEDSPKNAESLLGHDLFLYNAEKPKTFGLDRDLCLCPRLDNQASCHVLLKALLESPEAENVLMVVNDHEEIGSGSFSGARGPFLKCLLERICRNPETYHRTLAQSRVFSLDNAHSVHPNYADKTEPNHRIYLNGGPAIKQNANQSYASESELSGFVRHLCKKAGIPLQITVNRNDIRGGSTIGPLTATNLGCRTLDMGIPTLGMHSALETGGVKDLDYALETVKLLMREDFHVIRHENPQ